MVFLGKKGGAVNFLNSLEGCCRFLNDGGVFMVELFTSLVEVIKTRIQTEKLGLFFYKNRSGENSSKFSLFLRGKN